MASTTESIYISAQVAADRIGRSKRRVNQLVADGELISVRIGNMNAIQAKSVARYLSKRDTANGNQRSNTRRGAGK